MTPRPVIVSGGTGALGRAVTSALLRAGVRVAVPYRGTAAWEALHRDADPSRWPSPGEIAEVVLFLLSPRSAPVTGGLVPVPGRA